MLCRRLNHDGESDRAAQISLSYSHTCGLDGCVRCWSAIPSQLGYGTTEDIGDDSLPGVSYTAHTCGAVPAFDVRGC